MFSNADYQNFLGLALGITGLAEVKHVHTQRRAAHVSTHGFAGEIWFWVGRVSYIEKNEKC
jgi:hypothetical protein